VKRDQFCKALEKRREEISRCLVHEATVRVELLVRVSHENLRLQECVGSGLHRKVCDRQPECPKTSQEGLYNPEEHRKRRSSLLNTRTEIAKHETSR